MRDPVAGDYFAISPPGLGLGRALGVGARLCAAVLRFLRLCGSFEDAAGVFHVFLSHLK